MGLKEVELEKYFAHKIIKNYAFVCVCVRVCVRV